MVKVEGEAPPPVEMPPTEEELAAAEAAVVEQAAAVRALKEEGGLTNQVGGSGSGCLTTRARDGVAGWQLARSCMCKRAGNCI